MPDLLRAVKDDVRFVRSHTLQPKWYKYGKILLLVGGLAAYGWLFGVRKLAVFFAVFMILSLGVHLLYRTKTNKYTRSWLDFVVAEADGVRKPTRIGAWYYTFVVCNALIALAVSQLLA